MSWSSRRFPERPYAYVPGETALEPGEPIVDWRRALGFVAMAVVGLLYLWLARWGDSLMQSDPANVTNADRLMAKGHLAVALIFLNLTLGAYFWAKPRLPKPQSWLRTRVVGLVLAAPFVLLTWCAFSQVESNPWILELMDDLNIALKVALAAQLCLLPVVAFKRNRDHLVALLRRP